MSDTPTFGSSVKKHDEPTSVPDNTDAIYAAMRADLATDVTVELVPLAVPHRPKYEILYKPEIEWDLFETWLKRAAKNQKKTVNPLTLAMMVLSFTCAGVKYMGKDVVDDDGDAITFASPMLQQMMDTRSTQQTILRMYGSEGHIISTSGRVLEESGYGDVDIESGENPLD